jgi:hypothetical protein
VVDYLKVCLRPVYTMGCPIGHPIGYPMVLGKYH